MEQNLDYNIIKNLFINILLKKGKKANSEKIVKFIIKNIKKTTQNNPKKIIKQFIFKTSPKIKIIEVLKKKRYIKRKWKKKKKLFLLIFLYKDRQIKIPIKWLINNNKKNNNYIKLTQDIIQTTKNKGKIINLKKNYYNDIMKTRFFI